jgi:hypothetical protein
MTATDIAWEALSIGVPYGPVKHLPSIRNIPDGLWDENQAAASVKKTKDTIRRPAIPFRRVLDGMVFYTF